MNLLIEREYIQEMTCGSNFAYILNDNSIFLPTEYKVLQSQADDVFVKCMKLHYNGHIEIYYLTQTLKPLSSMIATIDPENFMTVMSNLLAAIIKVKGNGFLTCQNIDISFDKIFVDPSTFKISLIYLPLNVKAFDDYVAFENDLRTSLVKLISGTQSLASQKTYQFLSDLSNGMLRMEELYNRVKGVGLNHGGNVHKASSIHSAAGVRMPMSSTANNHNLPQQSIKLISINSAGREEIIVTKDEFVIGKNKNMVDGVITFNKMISRVHCKINRQGNNVTITDLQSANGTFVNRVRLQSNQPHIISDGDVVRMANSDFQVCIR